MSPGPGPSAQAAAPETAFRAFLRGLREPSLTSLVIAFVLAAALLAVPTFAIDEAFMMSPPARIFAVESADSPVYMTATLLGLRRGLPAEPQIYLFGSSNERAAIDPAQLAEEIRAATGRSVRVVPLASRGQRPVEALAMLGDLSPDARGVVVAGLGVPSLMHSKKTLQSLVNAPRLALRLPVLEDEAARAGIPLPARCDNYFWDNRRFFLPRVPGALQRAIEGAPEYVPMPYLGRGPPARAALEGKFPHKWREFGGDAGLAATRDASVEVLDRLADAVAARPSMRLVFIEDTVHPWYRRYPKFVDAMETARAAFREVSARHHVPFLQLQDRVGVGEDDFADTVHLRSPDAVAHMTHGLAVEIAPLVREIAR